MKETILPTHGMIFDILDNIFQREMLKNSCAFMRGYAPTSPTCKRKIAQSLKRECVCIFFFYITNILQVFFYNEHKVHTYYNKHNVVD